MGRSSSFPAMLSKGNNLCDFPFAYLKDKDIKWGLLLEERICSDESKFFFRIDL